MGNNDTKTVYGCVEWPAGNIKFFDLEDCLSQQACIVRDSESEHFGQVALTLSDANNEDCNDTFYGCVDWGTGKFEVIIPDSCCVEFGDNCQMCIDEGHAEAGETPKHILITLANGDIDVTVHSGTYPNCDFDRSYIGDWSCSAIATQNENNPCLWETEVKDEYPGFGGTTTYTYTAGFGGVQERYISRLSIVKDSDTTFALEAGIRWKENDSEGHLAVRSNHNITPTGCGEVDWVTHRQGNGEWDSCYEEYVGWQYEWDWKAEISGPPE